jgi:hypothetical protein
MKKILNGFIIFTQSMIVAIFIQTLIVYGSGKYWLEFLFFIRKQRGTSDYQGEELGMENGKIFFGILFPAVLTISFFIIYFLKKYNKKK